MDCEQTMIFQTFQGLQVMFGILVRSLDGLTYNLKLIIASFLRRTTGE